MESGLEKLSEMKKLLQDFMNYIYAKYNSLTREVAFCGMVIKKTIDIVSVAEYTYKNKIITVQISLLRLLCDNCLAIQSAKELGLPMLMNVINDNQRVNNLMVDEEQNMSDGYLKKLVSKQYPGFDKLYKFACDGVHFSKQAMSGAFNKNDDGTVNLNIKVGNPELKQELESNNNSMITLCKVIIDMLKKLVEKK